MAIDRNGAIGFVGLGVMGEPMCRNILRKSGRPVVAYDLAPEPVERLRTDGATSATSVADVVAATSVVFLSLPSGKHLQAICEGENGVIVSARAGQTIVDLGTSPVGLTRSIARRLAGRQVSFADAPVARTRQAAQDGTLSVMVGADAETYARIEPLLRCIATDLTHCGAVGAGQVVKIVNNMVLFETVNALAEALALGRRAGVDPGTLFGTLAKGSADSFALRNHGMKAMLPGNFPERAFSTEYALKDLSYALELGAEMGLRLRGAELARQILSETIEGGFGAKYFPVLSRIVDG